MHTPQSGKKGNEMTFGKKIERWTVIAAVCALLLAACLPFAFAEGTASAEGGAQAVTATAYGSLDTDDLWYFAEGELNLDGLKAHVEDRILPVLRANSVEPVVIAVVDTGLDRNNSLFAAGEHGSELLLRDKDQNLLGYNSFYAWKGDSAKANDSAYYLKDEANDKHGTAVSSVLAVLIRETGLSDYIKIYPVVASYSAEYVAEQDKSNITTNSFDPEAIRLGVEHAVSDAVGADVVNLSLCSTTGGEASWRDNAALQSTLTEASQTATVIAAAGNEGTASSAHYFYPAAYDNVIGVMGHAANNSPTDKTNYGSAYDIFAPGTGVMISTENGVFRTSGDGTSGTSMSAPFVSFAAALLRLSLTAETLADSSFVMPRNGIINDMVAELGEGDAVIKAKDGGEYKKLDILKLVSKDILDIDYAWDDPTEITVTASQNGSKLSDDATVTVQTLRETGKGRSLLEFTASVLPVGNTDPQLAAGIEWTLTQYDSDGEEISSVSLGKGGSVSHLFDKAGAFTVKATLTVNVGESEKTFSDEFSFTVQHPAWKSSLAHVVPEEFLSSSTYLYGEDGGVPSFTVLYGRGESMRFGVTTLEDVEYDSVSWYVNGTIAGTGATFEFFPEGMPGKDYEVTAVVMLPNGSTSYLGAFTVHHKSWAAHPLFAILWTALGVGVIAGGVVLTLHLKKRKAAAAETASDDKE